MTQMSGRYEYLAERVFKSLRGVDAIMCDLDVDTWSEERIIAEVIQVLEDHDSLIVSIEKDAIDRTRTWVARSIDSPITTGSPAYIQMTRATADKLAKQRKTKYGSLGEASNEVARQVYKAIYDIDSVDFSTDLEESEIMTVISEALKRYADLPESAIRAAERLAGMGALFPVVREQLLAGTLQRSVVGEDYKVVPYTSEWNQMFDRVLAESDRRIVAGEFEETTIADLLPTNVLFTDKIPGTVAVGEDGLPIERKKRGRKPGSRNRKSTDTDRIIELGIVEAAPRDGKMRQSI